jgi:hypothetical protein
MYWKSLWITMNHYESLWITMNGWFVASNDWWFVAPPAGHFSDFASCEFSHGRWFETQDLPKSHRWFPWCHGFDQVLLDFHRVQWTKNHSYSKGCSQLQSISTSRFCWTGWLFLLNVFFVPSLFFCPPKIWKIISPSSKIRAKKYDLRREKKNDTFQYVYPVASAYNILQLVIARIIYDIHFFT